MLISQVGHNHCICCQKKPYEKSLAPLMEKVSFDKTLFRKELKKAIKWVKPNEKTLLKV